MNHPSSSLFTVPLGPQAAWEVLNAPLVPGAGRIDLQVALQTDTRSTCPHGRAELQPVHDILERGWRHLKLSGI